jgi:hypothetical protein
MQFWWSDSGNVHVSGQCAALQIESLKVEDDESGEVDQAPPLSYDPSRWRRRANHGQIEHPSNFFFFFFFLERWV